MVRQCVLLGVALCSHLCARICSVRASHTHTRHAHRTQAESKQLDGKSGTNIAEDTRYRLRLLVREALDGNNVAALSQETAAYLYGTCNALMIRIISATRLACRCCRRFLHQARAQEQGRSAHSLSRPQGRDWSL